MSLISISYFKLTYFAKFRFTLRAWTSQYFEFKQIPRVHMLIAGLSDRSAVSTGKYAEKHDWKKRNRT
jgi:hypothetical protein